MPDNLNIILIVEDEAITALDIKNRLKEMGYEVAGIASTGQEAILMTESLKPDLILMDIVLKGRMDGAEAAMKISQRFNVPIIFLTALGDDETFKRAALSAPYGYMTKPFDERTLRMTIEIALFKHKMIQKVLAAETRYRALMENASCALIVHDVNGRIIEANKQALSLFGITQGELIGEYLTDFVMPEDAHYMTVLMKKVMIEKKIGPYELQLIQRKKEIKEIELSSVCIEQEGEVMLLTVLNDVTQQKQMRAQSLLSDKLATVGTLTAGIIHEINNPLNLILANLRDLNTKIAAIKFSSPGAAKLLTEALFAANKVKDIVNDLKAFSRADQQTLTLVDINKVVKSAISMAHPQFSQDATLETTLAENVPLLLLNDTKIHQVFLNLIINAAQSFKTKDINNNFIRVSTSVIAMEVVIQVSDNGSGIPPHLLKKIFEPFFTTKPVGVGTGLGLSICHDIVKSLGGRIQVNSILGQGTTITVAFPANATISWSKEPMIIDTEKIESQRILLVDDDPTSLLVLQRILSPHHQIKAIASGREALQCLTESAQEFDLIISDLNMPDINGVDLYHYLLTHREHLARSMIFITGGVYTASTQAFRQQVNNTFLEKPFTPDELIRAVTISSKMTVD